MLINNNYILYTIYLQANSNTSKSCNLLKFHCTHHGRKVVELRPKFIMAQRNIAKVPLKYSKNRTTQGNIANVLENYHKKPFDTEKYRKRLRGILQKSYDSEKYRKRLREVSQKYQEFKWPCPNGLPYGHTYIL